MTVWEPSPASKNVSLKLDFSPCLCAKLLNMLKIDFSVFSVKGVKVQYKIKGQ